MNAAAPRLNECQRLDKWLWHARACRTRTLATKLAASGEVRVNGQPVDKAHYRLKVGDVLTFPQGNHIRVWRVAALSERRGSPATAAALYEDLKPPTPENRLPRESNPAPPGRPTALQRRQLRRLREGS